MNLRAIAHIKRLLERLEGDQDFTRQVREDPCARPRVLEEAGIDLAAVDLDPFWKLLDLQGKPAEALQARYQELERHALWGVWHQWTLDVAAAHDKEAAEWVPSGDGRVTAWRARHLARIRSEIAAEGWLSLSPLFAFELSDGCSVGCRFCAFDPQRLRGWFAYTATNRELWRELLATALELFGPGSRAAICYHATEPSDNPDYLRFLHDFHEVIGNCPQTTTARPLKDLEWTRELLSMRAACDPGRVDRFSVFGAKALRAIHKAFTPEDLLDVRMVIHRAGMRAKAFSGRTRARLDAVSGEANAHLRSGAGSVCLPPQMTIECVCGYLVNMVDRSIRLISPCNASARWPLGYRVHAEGTFRDAAEFRAFILRSIDACMRPHLGRDDRVAFRPGLQYESHEDGFSLVARYRHHQLRGDPQFVLLGDLLRRGNLTTGEVTEALIQAGSPLFGLSAVSWLDKLYQAGLLMDFDEGDT